jgi:hypothetical protein
MDCGYPSQVIFNIIFIATTSFMTTSLYIMYGLAACEYGLHGVVEVIRRGPGLQNFTLVGWAGDFGCSIYNNLDFPP